MKATMTTKEVADDLRKCGVKTTEVKIRQMIRDERYPFGVACKTSSKWQFEIYTKLYQEWKEKHGISYIEEPVNTAGSVVILKSVEDRQKAVMELERAMKLV